MLFECGDEAYCVPVRTSQNAIIQNVTNTIRFSILNGHRLMTVNKQL